MDVLPGLGNGTFGAKIVSMAPNRVFASAMADFDAAMGMDVAVVGYQDDYTAVLKNTGNGSFAVTTLLTGAGTYSTGVTAGDASSA